MSKMRHWKQRFDPNAEFVFRKRLNLGDRIVEAGERVPKGEYGLTPHRLKMWWRAMFIERADWVNPLEAQHPYSQSPVAEEPQAPSTGMVHKGGGWYDVTLPDGSTDRVHGKVSAQLLLDEAGK